MREKLPRGQEYHRHLEAISRGEEGEPQTEQESHEQRTTGIGKIFSGRRRSKLERASTRPATRRRPAPNYQVDDEIEAREAIEEAARVHSGSERGGRREVWGRG